MMKKPHLWYKYQTTKEKNRTIHILASIKFLKGFILLIVAVKLLTLLDRNVDVWFSNFVTRHSINQEDTIVHKIAEKLTGLENEQLIMFSLGSFSNSALQLPEGVGLWFEKRRAEKLTVVATSLLIPVEVYEIFVKFTWVRVGALVVNLFVVWYLFTRLTDEKRDNLLEITTESPMTIDRENLILVSPKYS